MDDWEFKLPVDANNVPTGVLLNPQTCAATQYFIEKAREWNAIEKQGNYTKQQKKIWLWKLKAEVARGLCRAAQNALRDMAGLS